MIMRIDIAMTAALRPDVIRRTLQSLKNNITGAELNLIVDIAPVGDKRFTQENVVDVIKEYFPDAGIRVCSVSLQAEALKWTWDMVGTPYFLQWEDDWLLEAHLDLTPVIGFMNGWTDSGLVLFDRSDKSVLNHPGYKGKFRYIYDGFWERTEEKSLGGPPALVRKAYADEVCDIIDDKTCLDILTHEQKAQEILNRWRVCHYALPSGGFVHDIGKPWMKEHGLKRIKRTDKGVLWVKEENVR